MKIYCIFVISYQTRTAVVNCLVSGGITEYEPGVETARPMHSGDMHADSLQERLFAMMPGLEEAVTTPVNYVPGHVADDILKAFNLSEDSSHESCVYKLFSCIGM